MTLDNFKVQGCVTVRFTHLQTRKTRVRECYTYILSPLPVAARISNPFGDNLFS